MLRDGIAPEILLTAVDSTPGFNKLHGQSRWIIDICLDILRGTEPEVGGAQLIPLDLIQLIRRQVMSAVVPVIDKTVKNSPEAEKLRGYIDENWFEKLELGKYAEDEGISRTSMWQAFRGAYGLSPKQYHNRKRIEEAKVILMQTNWSVTDIAYECGFSDTAQFCRVFKITTDHTPSQFRSQASRAVVN